VTDSNAYTTYQFHPDFDNRITGGTTPSEFRSELCDTFDVAVIPAVSFATARTTLLPVSFSPRYSKEVN
jgi:hypothetical protein